MRKIDMEDKNKYISEYLIEIDKVYKSGVAKEHSYRSALEILMKKLLKGKRIVNEPKKIDCGKPDFIIFNEDIQFGFIETKDIDIEINKILKTEQIQRYKEALDNIIITNYIDFIYYKDETTLLNANIASIVKGSVLEKKEGINAFLDIIDNFSKYEGKIINSSEQLAVIMSRKSKLLSDIIYKRIIKEKYEDYNLRKQKRIFTEYLIHDLTDEMFSNIYSQTIAYGLFAAKLYGNKNTEFSKYTVSELIPRSNLFLKKFFHYIMGSDVDEIIKWYIDIFADMFNYVDIEKIKTEFNKRDEDPYIYFYELFLKEFDKEEKKERGVFYTPVPIVKFIINSVDYILKKDFKITKGIADDSKIIKDIFDVKEGKTIKKEYSKIQILDPATGTGTFLSEIIDKIYKTFKDNKGMWEEYCENDLIKRIHGFEYMMASYVMANIKIDMKLKDTGVDINNIDNHKRLSIYLTNTLEEINEKQINLELEEFLKNESEKASEVKKNVPVMVVLGNPPYNKDSKNDFKNEMYDNYKTEPGGIEALDVQNKKPLVDDYVKFIAFGHSLIHKYSEGILAYINNFSFLDNETNRGMRWQLLSTFDKIYILNLNGDVEENKGKLQMKGDENVFPIKKGVSINIFIKNNKKKKNELAIVKYAELIGKKDFKLKYLTDNNFNSINWVDIELKEPLYLFKNNDYTNDNEYRKGFDVSDLFIEYSESITTGRDNFTMRQTRNEMIDDINTFLSLDNEKARITFGLGEDSNDWKIEFAKNDLQKYSKNNKLIDTTNIVKIQYKPFDVWYTYFSGRNKGFHRRPQDRIMRNYLSGNNIGLIFKKGFKLDAAPVFVTKNISINRCWSRSGMQGADFSMPLYIYDKDSLAGFENKKLNLNNDIINQFELILNLKCTDDGISNKSFHPIDILYYIYSVLNSKLYLTKFKELLNIGFPLVKYPNNEKEFKKLVKLGKELIQLHLMEEIKDNDKIKYPVSGNNYVDKINYTDNKVFINDTQYFSNISSKVWSFFIGGYQPVKKWIKDRKGKTLNNEQKKHYMSIIYVIEETIKLQAKIDEVIIL